MTLYSDAEAQREGLLSPSRFRSRVGASLHLLQRLGLTRRLEGHTGCVNTVTFTPDGEGLLSGSDDQLIKLWDWRRGVEVLSYDSGHTDNVFQARAIPGTDNRTVVSSGADGQVRLGLAGEAGSVRTRCVARHNGRAHKLALVPGAAGWVLSCGEDGRVLSMDVQRGGPAIALVEVKSPQGRPLPLNSVACTPLAPTQCVLGAADEVVRVFDLRMAGKPLDELRRGQLTHTMAPPHLSDQPRRREVHVTCAVYSRRGEILASYNDENVYLFAPTAGARPPAPDASSARPARRRARGSEEGEAPVRLAPPPAWTGSGAGSTGRADWGGSVRRGSRARAGRGGGGGGGGAREAETEEGAAARDATPPIDPPAATLADELHEVTVTAAADVLRALDATGGRVELVLEGSEGEEDGEGGAAGRGAELAAWRAMAEELRASTAALSPSSSGDEWEGTAGSGSDAEAGREGGLSAGAGAGAAVPGPAHAGASWSTLQRATWSTNVLQVYRGHRNAQTVKGVSFLGPDDEWVLSGSDDGHIFIWEREGGKLVALLEGDRHIVNCLAPHPTLPHVLASSGIDSDVKVWGVQAGEPAALGAAASILMARNAEEQGSRYSRSYMVSAQVLQSMMRQAAAGEGGRGLVGPGECVIC
ncbi:hypothetical protein ACKKBG_A37510 [Auxenochlorella protothecoides x Auxenochlorella symbiontica]